METGKQCGRHSVGMDRLKKSDDRGPAVAKEICAAILGILPQIYGNTRYCQVTETSVGKSAMTQRRTSAETSQDCRKTILGGNLPEGTELLCVNTADFPPGRRLNRAIEEGRGVRQYVQRCRFDQLLITSMCLSGRKENAGRENDRRIQPAQVLR